MRLSANLGLGALLALAIVRLWLMPLPSSLWMDEAITAFLVQYGPAHPSLAALPALSPIYTALPRCWWRCLPWGRWIFDAFLRILPSARYSQTVPGKFAASTSWSFPRLADR